MKTPIKRILFPTDFSDDATHALDYATSLAEDYGAEICLLHVVEEIVIPSYFGPQQAGVYINLQDLEEAAEKELTKILAGPDGAGVKVQRMIRRGRPSQEILDVADEVEADIIVMGTHGHGPLAKALMGSTAERVVRKSTRPVLTIRHAKRNGED